MGSNFDLGIAVELVIQIVTPIWKRNELHVIPQVIL